jgi:hypothetical protein
MKNYLDGKRRSSQCVQLFVAEIEVAAEDDVHLGRVFVS